MNLVPRPLCLPVNLGDLVELALEGEGSFPGAPGGGGRGFHVRLRSDGSLVGSSIDSTHDEHSCAGAAAMLDFARRVELRVPPENWRPVATPPPEYFYWDGVEERLVQVVWRTRSGTRVARVALYSELDAAVRDLLGHHPSYERNLRRRIESEEVPAATLNFSWTICGHCGRGFVSARVRADGLYLYETRPGEYGSHWTAGRFDPSQARSLFDWLGRRDALTLEGHSGSDSVSRPRSRDGYPLLQVWADATGFDISDVLYHTVDATHPSTLGP